MHGERDQSGARQAFDRAGDRLEQARPILDEMHKALTQRIDRTATHESVIATPIIIVPANRKHPIPSAGMLNPNSQYYLSFNLRFPNRLESALGYSGEALMVHGACSSSGCFALHRRRGMRSHETTRTWFQHAG